MPGAEAQSGVSRLHEKNKPVPCTSMLKSAFVGPSADEMLCAVYRRGLGPDFSVVCEGCGRWQNFPRPFTFEALRAVGRMEARGWSRTLSYLREGRVYPSIAVDLHLKGGPSCSASFGYFRKRIFAIDHVRRLKRLTRDRSVGRRLQRRVRALGEAAFRMELEARARFVCHWRAQRQ